MAILFGSEGMNANPAGKRSSLLNKLNVVQHGGRLAKCSLIYCVFLDLTLRTMPSLHTLARDPLVEILLDQQQERLDFQLGSAFRG